jgi:hypothetical protein
MVPRGARIDRRKKMAKSTKATIAKTIRKTTPRPVRNKASAVEVEGGVPSTTFVLNKAGRALFGEDESVRVRVSGQNIELRPTHRTKGLGNLPKSEKVLKVTRTSNVTKFSANIQADHGQAYQMDPMKYGWLKLVPVDEVKRDMAAVTVSNR